MAEEKKTRKPRTTSKAPPKQPVEINLSGYSTVHLDCSSSVLQERRLVLEMTQRQVAEKAGIPLSTYIRFENDRSIRTAAFDVACRVLEALELNIVDFFHGIYSIGEEVYFDEKGQKYVKTGRLVTDDIDEEEAINVMRVHIADRSLVIPMKILRALNQPSMFQLMYHEHDKRLGFRILKDKLDNTVVVPKDVYCGKWRGIRINNERFMDLIYSIMGRDTGRYFMEPAFFEQGCILALDETMKSDYKIKEDDYYLLEIE